MEELNSQMAHLKEINEGLKYETDQVKAQIQVTKEKVL